MCISCRLTTFILFNRSLLFLSHILFYRYFSPFDTQRHSISCSSVSLYYSTLPSQKHYVEDKQWNTSTSLLTQYGCFPWFSFIAENLCLLLFWIFSSERVHLSDLIPLQELVYDENNVERSNWTFCNFTELPISEAGIRFFTCDNVFSNKNSFVWRCLCWQTVLDITFMASSYLMPNTKPWIKSFSKTERVLMSLVFCPSSWSGKEGYFSNDNLQGISSPVWNFY